MKENGYQVSKYPSSIGNIIKCRIRREKILNQPTTVDRFVDFKLEMMRIETEFLSNRYWFHQFNRKGPLELIKDVSSTNTSSL